MTGPDRVGLTVHDSIDSTNEEARRQIAAGRTGPLWIAARQQTAGRGRRGRAWSSRPGNLAATFLCHVDGPPSQAALFSFVAALAVADTLAVLAPGQETALKWPNDVLLNGGKVSGILLESLGGAGTPTTQLAIGVGLNLAHHPDVDDGTWAPTSVQAETGAAPDFDTALDALTRAMESRLDRHRTQGFERTRADWLARAVNLGGPVQVRLPGQTLSGTFAGLDTTGALVLEQATGRHLIAAGDVFFAGVS